MLDYYLDQIQATAGERPEHQSRFSTDGSLWLWEYEKNKTPAEFQRLVNAIKSGHISAPKNPLGHHVRRRARRSGHPIHVLLRTARAALRADFPLAIAMEKRGDGVRARARVGRLRRPVFVEGRLQLPEPHPGPRRPPARDL
jgi:alpha-mannosidase